MASSRLCGYCRQEGHQATKCEVKQSHVNEIVNHTKGERKFLIDMMVKNGMGLGATIMFANYGGYPNETFILTTADWVKDIHCVSQKRVRYSKQVKVTPKRLIDRIGDSLLAEQYGYINAQMLSMDASEMRNVNLWIRGVCHPITLKDGTEIDPSGNRNIYIISPSHEPYDLIEADYGKNIQIHKRLLTKEQISKMRYRWEDSLNLDF